MDKISELEIAAWHEAAHACVGLRLGHVPSVVEINNAGGGSCQFRQALGREHALLIGMAGDLVCDEMLGVPDTASPQDVALAQPQWERLYATGRRDRVQQNVIRQASRLCWDLRPQIECLANKLMKSRRIDGAKLGSLCRTYQPLAQFKGMFPRPKPQPVATVRRQTAKPSTATIPTFQPALRPKHSVPLGDRLIAQALAGRGIVFGIPREYVQRMLATR